MDVFRVPPSHLLLALLLSPLLAAAVHPTEGRPEGTCNMQEPPAAAAADPIPGPPRKPYFPQRFHVLAIPHTVTSKDYCACPFTQKIIRFNKIMVERGHTIYHYGHERSQVAATEHITVTTDKLLIESYGSLNYWKKDLWKYDPYKDTVYKVFARKATAAVAKRCKKDDFLLLFFGHAQSLAVEGIKKKCPGIIIVEPSVGYPMTNVFAPYRVFESYFYQGSYYTYDGKAARWYDAVIPSGFDLEDWDYSEKKQDFCVFMARLSSDKGLPIAIQATEAAGCKLVVAGQGSLDALGYKQLPPHVEYIGVADTAKRRQLMRDAKVLLLPTQYQEPYGFVVIEAQLSGTPVVTTDWGAFAETVLHGVTGFRCRTHEQFVWSLKNIHKLDHRAIRRWAVGNFGLELMGDRYEEYFDVLARNNRQGGDWYYKNAEREIWDLPLNYFKAFNGTV